MEEPKMPPARRRWTVQGPSVRLVLKEGQTPAQVARDLGLVDSVLRSCVPYAKIDRVICPAFFGPVET